MGRPRHHHVLLDAHDASVVYSFLMGHMLTMYESSRKTVLLHFISLLTIGIYHIIAAESLFRWLGDFDDTTSLIIE